MYIECQECDTTFRLDESLLKPTGSKVRCSQCGSIFVALPPSATEPAPIAQEFVAPAAPPGEPPTPAQTPEAVSQPSEESGEELGLQDVDLAELDTLFAQGQEIPAKTSDMASKAEEVDVSAESDEIDFEIDFEAALEADDSMVATPAQESATTADAEGAPDDMDLELDFDLGDDLGDLGAEEATPAMDKGPAESSQDIQALQDVDDDASQDEFELALDDVDLDDGGDATVFSDMASQGSKDPGVGLDQDATVFASPDESGQDEGISDLDIDLEHDLDLDLEMQDESKAAESASTSAAESEAVNDLALDDDFFSDLDSILDGTHLDDGPDDSETKEEVELELDEDSASAEADQIDPGAGDDDLEELAFELDAEYEDKPIAQTDEGEPSLGFDETDSEIDLTEIELMLEGDAEHGITGVRGADEIGEKTSAGDDFDLGLEDEIDLAELTAAIESAELTSANDTATLAEDELELALTSEDALDDVTDLSLDDDMASPAQPITADSPEVDESDDELDLSDLDDLVMETPPTAERDIVESGDIELEFQIEEEDQDDTPQVQEQLDTLTPDTAPVIDQTLEMPKSAEEPEPVKAPKQKKKSSKLLLFILILVLLGVIGYGIYYADTEMGIKIPYVSDYVTYIRDYVTPKPKDPAGTANLSTLEINSKFIENEQSGRLFVITGKVHNGYQNSRGQIHLQGKIFTRGKVLAQTESVFAGTILNDQELATIPFADIKKQLASPPQQGTPGVKVLPNQNLAFMVAFSNLPPADDLEEFAVEVVKSTQIQ